MSEVLTLGTFDTPHMGHAAFLRKSERFGHLVVGVNTDEFVTAYKGAPPVFTYAERAGAIQRLGYATMPNAGPGRDTIQRLDPDIVTIGTDWLRRDYLKQIDVTVDDLEAWGVQLVFIPYSHGVSTTMLKERLRG